MSQESKDLDIEISGRDFFLIVKGKPMHGLKYLKTVDHDLPGWPLTFFHKVFYFEHERHGRVYAVVATVFGMSGDENFMTSFVHACGEPSEIGPRFVKASEEET